ncbi:MAG: DUF1653 domain-containing protein [Lachnospiraceae bacterium]|nr:DUF1653 domain-containing protein [Lachnospiraceae bacterium]
MRDNPKPQEIYRHFKGGLYQIITLAKHSQTGEMLVIYQALYEDFAVYARELSEFLSETDREKYPSASQEYRFEKAEWQKADVLRQEAGKQEGTEREEKISEEQIEETINIDPLVMEFLDADTYEERLNILTALHSRITDEMINTMSVAVDVEINEGDIEERYDALKTCLVTLEKYECNRLR